MSLKTAIVTWVLTNIIVLLLSLAYYDPESTKGSFLFVVFISLLITAPVHYLQLRMVNKFARKSRYGHFIENIILVISFLLITILSFLILKGLMVSGNKLIMTTTVTYALVGSAIWGVSIFSYNNGDIREDEDAFNL